MRTLFWSVARGAIGVFFGFLAGIMLIPAAAGIVELEQRFPIARMMLWLPAVVGLLLGIFAPTLRCSFGRSFLLLGTSLLLLPISTMLLAERVTTEMLADSGNVESTVAGAAMAGKFMFWTSAFIGFGLGAVCFVIGLGLLLGGRQLR